MISAIRQRAFTLIELLVVIGLIAFLAGGIGVALLDGNSGNALQNSQGVVSSLASVARSKSALFQGNVALAVNTTPNTDGFLREFRIVAFTNGTVGNTTVTRWVASGDPTLLDRGVHFVPPTTQLSSSVDFKPAATDWTNLASNSLTLNPANDIDIYLSDLNTKLSATDKYRLVLVFTALGTVVLNPAGTTAPVGGRIALSPGVIAADGKITFDKPDAVRGLLISDYGVSTLLNEAEAFKP
jgi:prepilin-type N-terminal cleavage/methylation domain-containing protein